MRKFMLAAIGVSLVAGCAATRTPEKPTGPHFRVMTWNVNWGGPGPELVPQTILAEDSDIVCLQETTRRWERFLRPRLDKHYPHILFHHSRGAGGLAFLSKFPLEEKSRDPSPVGWFPAWTVVAETPIGPVEIQNLHLHPAVNERGSFTPSAYFSYAPKARLKEVRAFDRAAAGVRPQHAHVGMDDEPRDPGERTAGPHLLQQGPPLHGGARRPGGRLGSPAGDGRLSAARPVAADGYSRLHGLCCFDADGKEMRMKRLGVPALIVVLLAFVVAFIMQARRLSRMEYEMEELRRDLRQQEAGTAAVPKEVDGLPPRGEEPAARKSQPEAVPEEAPKAAPPASIASQRIEELVDEIVRQRVQEEVEKQLPKKRKAMSVGDVSKKLDLDPYTEKRMEELVNAGKDQSFDLLRSPRSDGGNFIDDIVTLKASENPEEQYEALLKRLNTDQVPGTNQTYTQRLAAIGEETNAAVRTLLTTEQWEAYSELSLDPLKGIETGYDPWDEYFREK
ncbi:MAG: endonuclease/exonuclease/phosphatase family protein [Planctomycetota bacterium]|jgi:hypothetical protein